MDREGGEGGEGTMASHSWENETKESENSGGRRERVEGGKKN